jgi:hypothetical protein
MQCRRGRANLRRRHLRRIVVESRTSVSLDEWFQIEKERRRESDRMRVFDFARRLRAASAAGNHQDQAG